jgi:hypothetical protein
MGDWSREALEGSRFITRQLCRQIAGGSREQPNVSQLYRPYQKLVGHPRRIAPSPLRPFALSPFRPFALSPKTYADPFASTASSPRAAPVMMATTSDIVCFCGLVRAARRPRRMI